MRKATINSVKGALELGLWAADRPEEFIKNQQVCRCARGSGVGQLFHCAPSFLVYEEYYTSVLLSYLSSVHRRHIIVIIIITITIIIISIIIVTVFLVQEKRHTPSHLSSRQPG